MRGLCACSSPSTDVLSLTSLRVFFIPHRRTTMHHIRLLICLLSVSTGLSLHAQQPKSPLVDSFESYQQMKQKTEFGFQWIGIGPVVNSARVESVQLDPSTPGTMYVAFGSGNLWKTINNGITWRPLFENQASHGIGDIALAPSDPNVIYLGTGESLKKARNFTIPGTGVYRSVDGGENWTHLGLSDSWHIGEIEVHPNDADVAIVAVLGHFWSTNPNRGLYRTEDGGETWQHVLKMDENTGANDVVWAQDDPNVVYASMWENHPGVSGANSSVHKSIDGGVTWTKCSKGLPLGDQIGRIGLAVSHSNSNKVYALVDNREKIGSGAAEVFQSLDGGTSWNRTHSTDLKFFSRIGWYFADLYVNPKNDDEIFGLGVRVAHSTDGGKTFEYLGGKVAHVNPSAASGLHLDHCEMWINPMNPNHLVLGSDGGLYQSFDKGQTWVHFNNLPTGEFYDIAVDHQNPYRIYAGAQDNATVFGSAQEMIDGATSDWKYLWIDPWNGGDGCITLVDPNDPNTVYFSAQEGAFRRKNLKTNRGKGISPNNKAVGTEPIQFNFVAPMSISPHDSNKLLLGGNVVLESKNRGDDWEVISPDIAKNTEATRKAKAASAIAESPIKPGLIYVGTDKGAIWTRENSDLDWEEKSLGLPIAYARSIAPSRHAESRVYLAMTGLNYDKLGSHLFCSENYGATWKSISANLPDEPANVILEDPFYENILYLGSFRGVYISLDRGQSWSTLGDDLPACSIADLEIQEREKDLVIATHGRGIYKLNLKPLYQFHAHNHAANEQNQLYPIPTANLPYRSDIRPGLNFRNFEKTTITFWLSEPGEVALKITKDAKSMPLATFRVDGKKGFNQFRWDLVLETTDSPQPYFINYKKYLPKGEYRIQLETDAGIVQEQEFSVVESRRE